MAYVCEKRRCRRFEIPGAKAKFRKRGLLVSVQAFSEPCPVINVSKGGMAFICSKKLSTGKKLLVQLLVPNETPLSLKCIVRGQEQVMGSGKKFTRIELMPFGGRHGWNAREKLDVLRSLDQKYGGKDEKAFWDSGD